MTLQEIVQILLWKHQGLMLGDLDGGGYWHTPTTQTRVNASFRFISYPIENSSARLTLLIK